MLILVRDMLEIIFDRITAYHTSLLRGKCPLQESTIVYNQGSYGEELQGLNEQQLWTKRQFCNGRVSAYIRQQALFILPFVC